MKIRIFVYSIVLVALSIPGSLYYSATYLGAGSQMARTLDYYTFLIAPAYVLIASFITLVLFVKNKKVHRTESGSVLLFVFVMIVIVVTILSNLSGISGMGAGQ